MKKVSAKQEQNKKTISNAMERLAISKHRTMIEGMKKLLAQAMDEALAEHARQDLQSHLKTGDSYGWILGYNGHKIDMEITLGHAAKGGGVNDELEKLIAGTGAGYVGIVMAGLEPAHYYKVEFEEIILENTMDMVETLNLFHKI